MLKTIEFLDVSKYTKNRDNGLFNVNFTCVSGQNYFLYGNSCSGKTIIFQLLLRDISPSSGIINICGDNLQKFDEQQFLIYKQQLGIIWQQLFLIEQKTVFENIALPLVLRGEDKREIEKKVDNLLKDADLFEERNLLPLDLALGQRQIVAILRALITTPKILLADEPMNHLDTNQERIMWQLMNKYKDPNATIFFITSQQYIIENFEGNILDLKNGNVIAR